MKRFPSTRRLAAIAGGVLLGATAVLTIAGPASAHHSAVSGKSVCDPSTGEWVVTWTVDSYAPKDVKHYKLIKADLTPAGSSVTTIKQVTDDSYPYKVGEPLVGEQRVPGDATAASLEVQAQWDNGYEEHKPVGSKVEFGGPCEKDKPKPNASFQSACDGSVTVTLTNAKDAKAPAEFTVEGGADYSKTVTVKPGDSVPVTVPAEAAEKIVVTVGDEEFTGGFEAPKDCAPIKVASQSDCDSLTISVENPKGSTPVDATLTPKGGEAEKVTVAPGETKEVTFDAEQGFEVTLTIGGKSGTIEWKQPADCGGAAGGGPSLPVTGASIGTAVGIGAVLLAAGAGLFFALRRRRIRFTA